ncbi:MAG: hypothetical protein RBT79_08055 [Chiayiivirga sp.]|jgi:hypothetical protein|nr:hypothetical protein [Chiayiivirga sp.]
MKSKVVMKHPSCARRRAGFQGGIVAGAAENVQSARNGKKKRGRFQPRRCASAKGKAVSYFTSRSVKG